MEGVCERTKEHRTFQPLGLWMHRKWGGMPNHTSHAPKDAFWGLEWPFKGYVFLRPFRPVDVHGSRPRMHSGLDFGLSAGNGCDSPRHVSAVRPLAYSLMGVVTE